jgi:hypothetical protein
VKRNPKDSGGKFQTANRFGNMCVAKVKSYIFWGKAAIVTDSKPYFWCK